MAEGLTTGDMALMRDSNEFGGAWIFILAIFVPLNVPFRIVGTTCISWQDTRQNVGA